MVDVLYLVSERHAGVIPVILHFVLELLRGMPDLPDRLLPLLFELVDIVLLFISVRLAVLFDYPSDEGKIQVEVHAEIKNINPLVAENRFKKHHEQVFGADDLDLQAAGEPLDEGGVQGVVVDALRGDEIEDESVESGLSF